MSLTEARFHDLVDATQEKLEDVFDDSGLDVDLESSAGADGQFGRHQLIFIAKSRCVSWFGGAILVFPRHYKKRQWQCDKSEELYGRKLTRLVQDKRRRLTSKI